MTGTPATGFELTSRRARPADRHHRGRRRDPRVPHQDRHPAAVVSGAASDVTGTVGLVLPDGRRRARHPTVRVTATSRRPRRPARSASGIVLSGAQADRTYRLSTDQVLVTLGGTAAALASLQGDELVVTADVDGLGAGGPPVGRSRRRCRPASRSSRSARRGDRDGHAAASRPRRRRRRRRPDRVDRRPDRCPDSSAPTGSAASPTSTSSRRIAYALGRATAHRLVGAGGALVVGQDTRRSCDMFVAAISAGATSLGVDVHLVGVVPDARPSRSSPARASSRPGSWSRPPTTRPTTTASRSSTSAASSSTTTSRTSSRRSSGGPRSWPASATPSSAGSTTAAACSNATATSRLALARAISTDVRIVLDCANGSGGVVGPEILAATGAQRRGHPQRPRRREHQRPGRGHRAGRAGRGGRGPRAPTSASPSTATPTGSSRSTRAGAVVDGDQVLGILALDRLARGVLTERRARRVGPLERRAPDGRRGGRRAGHPDAGRRQVHPRGDAGQRRVARRREERPRHRPRAHDLGRRHRHRARGPAGHGPRAGRRCASSPRRSRSCRSSNGRCPLVTGTSGRAIRPPGRDPRGAHERLGPGGRILVRPSGHGTGPAGHGRGHRRTSCRRAGRLAGALGRASV